MSLPWLLALLLAPARAEAGAPFFSMPAEAVPKALAAVHRAHPRLDERIAAVSELFLGTPYRLGPLGEGPSGRFDRGPLIDFAAVDCMTLVEQVLALSLDPEPQKALALLRRIRYANGRVAYETRNHFTDADWLPNNIAAGFIQDVTREVAGERAAAARKLISKRNWYAAKISDDLSGLEALAPARRAARLRELRALGRGLPDAVAEIPYIPLELLPELAGRIPSGTIVSVVREDRPDKPTLVSHMGLLIVKDGVPYFRHAAAGKTVEDVPALEYVRRQEGASWRVLGLNLARLRVSTRKAGP